VYRPDHRAKGDRADDEPPATIQRKARSARRPAQRIQEPLKRVSPACRRYRARWGWRDRPGGWDVPAMGISRPVDPVDVSVRLTRGVADRCVPEVLGTVAAQDQVRLPEGIGLGGIIPTRV
jgi:hypothetical protein